MQTNEKKALHMTLQQLNGNRERHRQLDMAYEMLESLSMDGMPGKSDVSDCIGNIAIAIADLKNRISQLEDGIDIADNEIREFANSFEDVRIQQIIQHRFISGMTWEQIAELMGPQFSAHSLRQLFSRRVLKGK